MIVVIKGRASLVVRDSLVRSDKVKHGNFHIIFHHTEKLFMSAGRRVWVKYDEVMEDPVCDSMRPKKILAAAQAILDSRVK